MEEVVFQQQLVHIQSGTHKKKKKQLLWNNDIKIYPPDLKVLKLIWKNIFKVYLYLWHRTWKPRNDSQISPAFSSCMSIFPLNKLINCCILFSVVYVHSSQCLLIISRFSTILFSESLLSRLCMIEIFFLALHFSSFILFEILCVQCSTFWSFSFEIFPFEQFTLNLQGKACLRVRISELVHRENVKATFLIPAEWFGSSGTAS